MDLPPARRAPLACLGLGLAPRLVLATLLALAPRLAAAQERGEDLLLDPDRTETARAADAAVTHGMITPRAQTLPAGQTAVHVQDLALVGVSYGYSDDVQATAQALLPLDDGLPLAALVRGKVVLKRGPQAVISARADVGVAVPRSSLSGEQEPGQSPAVAASYGLGATADLHLDGTDRLVVFVGGSLHAGAGRVDSRVLELQGDALLLYEGGARWRIKGPVHLLGELWVPVVIDGTDVDLAPYLVAPVGLRLATRVVSLDAGFLLGKAADVSSTDFPIGVPWVAGTLRFR